MIVMFCYKNYSLLLFVHILIKIFVQHWLSCVVFSKSYVLEKLEEGIVLILCKLERIFPPAFFDVMVHLMVHLPREAKLAGPVSYRWMYPFERYIFTFFLFINILI